MTEQQTIITGLKREKRKIDEDLARVQKDIDALQRERDAIDITISRFSGNGQLAFDDEIEVIITEPMGPTAAIRQLFTRLPTKKWYPGSIRDELNDMKKHGELSTESKSMLNTVHWILRSMVDVEIQKGGVGRKRWYRKLQT